MDLVPDLHTIPAEDITTEIIRNFITTAIRTRLQAESLVLEFKSQVTREIVIAVAAMTNTSGGLVIVGVDENAADPLIGITHTDIDAVAQKIRDIAPGATPEFIAVAIDGSTDRAILLLRIDPDRSAAPIVINGRVYVRIPGHNQPARRDEIINLVNTHQTLPDGSGATGGIPLDPARFTGFGDEPEAGTLRIHAQFLLPRHATARRYLGTESIRATTHALVQGPVPNHVCSDLIRTREMGEVYWVREDSAALRFTLRCEPRRHAVRGAARFSAHVHISLSGRILDTIVQTALIPADAILPLAIEDLRDQVLATTYSAVAAGHAVAESIKADAPLRPPRLTGWFKGPIRPLVQLRRMWDAPDDRDRSEFRFDTLIPSSTSIAGLDEITREWLTPFLLNLGATAFEEELARFEVPAWVQRLGLG